MKLKVKLKSIYRRYKKYPSAWCIIINLIVAAIPPYINIGTLLSLMFAASFGVLLCQERRADYWRRVAHLISRKSFKQLDALVERLHTFERAEEKRDLYSNYQYCAGDQFYYDGAWHNVASVNFQEGLIAYDISTDEDDDLQLVWLRFENIESYKPHFQQ